MKKINRRKFLQASGLITVAGMGGLKVGFSQSLNGAINSSGRDLLVYVFLDGGMDGLNMIPPRSGADYTEYSTVLRPSLHISNSESLALNGQTAFGMHPSAPELANLFNQDKMAIVHATGLTEANRSHFVATALMELGVPSPSLALNSGWLTRYFQSTLHPDPNALIPSLIPDYNNTDAVLGDPSSLVMGNPNEFSLDAGHWAWESYVQSTLHDIYTVAPSIEKMSALQTLNASAVVNSIDWQNYNPGNSAVYPGGYFGDQLKMVAQIYKENVGLEVAYVPYGGWDTHVGQGTGTTGVFADLTQGLSQGLNALYQDLSATHPGQFTIIVQSEFGRRAYQNGDDSTDHGYGNPMFLIGDNVNGGFHGSFPGLQPHQLFEGDDVNATVDYRDVVSEVLIKRMKNRFLGFIFPGYNTYNPLGVVSGDSMTPIWETDYDPLFASGFD